MTISFRTIEENEKYLTLVRSVQELCKKNSNITEADKKLLYDKIKELNLSNDEIEEAFFTGNDSNYEKINREEEIKRSTCATRINFDRILLLITLRCNFECDNCVTNCNKKQAPSNEIMSLENIERFIKDTIECNKKYKIVILSGGEPTLHPQFKEICLMFEKANRENHFASSLMICTNGYASKTKELLKFAEEHSFVIQNSNKTEEQRNKTMKWRWFPFNVAPVDVGYEPSFNGCEQSETCGLGYDNKGYWGCPHSAIIAKIFDYESVCTSVKELTEDKIKKSWEQHCKLCGAAFPIPIIASDYLHKSEPNTPIDIVTTQPTGRVIDQTMSKTWVEAFKKCHEKIKKIEEKRLIEEDGY